MKKISRYFILSVLVFASGALATDQYGRTEYKCPDKFGTMMLAYSVHNPHGMAVWEIRQYPGGLLFNEVYNVKNVRPDRMGVSFDAYANPIAPESYSMYFDFSNETLTMSSKKKSVVNTKHTIKCKDTGRF